VLSVIPLEQWRIQLADRSIVGVLHHCDAGLRVRGPAARAADSRAASSRSTPAFKASRSCDIPVCSRTARKLRPTTFEGVVRRRGPVRYVCSADVEQRVVARSTASCLRVSCARTRTMFWASMRKRIHFLERVAEITPVDAETHQQLANLAKSDVSLAPFHGADEPPIQPRHVRKPFLCISSSAPKRSYNCGKHG